MVLPVLDEHVLADQMRPLGARAADVIDLWLGDLDGRVEAIAMATRASLPQRLAIAAHTLRGSAMYVGAARLAERCAEIERNLNAGAAPESQTDLARLVRDDAADAASALRAITSRTANGATGAQVAVAGVYDQASHDHREAIAVSTLMERMRAEVRRHGAGARRKGVFVLVVDDSEEIRVALHAVLSAEGFNVLLAQTAQEAMSVVAHADVVVTDLMMPGVSGLDLLRAIRLSGFTVPVIVLTAGGMQNLAADALAAGAQRVVDKTDVLTLPVLVDSYAERRTPLTVVGRSGPQSGDHAPDSLRPSGTRYNP